MSECLPGCGCGSSQRLRVSERARLWLRMLRELPLPSGPDAPYLRCKSWKFMDQSGDLARLDACWQGPTSSARLRLVREPRQVDRSRATPRGHHCRYQIATASYARWVNSAMPDGFQTSFTATAVILAGRVFATHDLLGQGTP